MHFQTFPRWAVRSCLFVVFAGVVTGALAHSGASGIVDTRMETMKDISLQMKTIDEMLKGGAALEAATIKTAAERINDHADKITDMFPKDSLHGPTKARSEIWSDWGHFVTFADDLGYGSATLSEIAESESREEIAEAFKIISRTCSGCHEAFRIKK